MVNKYRSGTEFDTQFFIANEMAEANRLKRIELNAKYDLKLEDGAVEPEK
jgi:hypothetical protein